MVDFVRVNHIGGVSISFLNFITFISWLIMLRLEQLPTVLPLIGIEYCSALGLAIDV